MTYFNRILTSVALIAMLGSFVTTTHAQTPTYYGALLYNLHADTSEPPVYVGQPPTVTTAYLWLDEAMRLYPESTIEHFIKMLSWNDTAQTIASNFYKMQDDDPLSFYIWSGDRMHPDPYKAEPSLAREVFENFVSTNVGDTARTSWLLSTDIIADITVSDTSCKFDPTAMSVKDWVLVNATILDPIKGKKIPECPDYFKTGKKVELPLTLPTLAFPAHAVAADTGTCIQFQYSPELRRSLDEDVIHNTLKDSSGGWWVKPSHEYIVFLSFVGIGADSSSAYFTTCPHNGSTGNSGGIYPVKSGIVQDPYDDFGLGGTGLTVAEWKSRLRARINLIVSY